jgi:hypothetical protein
LAHSISKLYLLNLDLLFPIIKPLYSNTGRSAKNQQGIRSLVLMLAQGFHDLRLWAAKVAADKLLCAICGFQFGDAPTFSSYYDFTRRLWLASTSAKAVTPFLARFTKRVISLPSGRKTPTNFRAKETSFREA